MTKNSLSSSSQPTSEIPRDFYRPHKRVYYDPHLTNPKTGEVYIPERRVKQSFVTECDINTIMKQYSQTGQIRHISAKAAQGAYLDLPDEIDFQTALQIVKDGESAFGTLPSKVRDRFSNDPARFLDFMSDPANAEEAVKLGLATARPEPVAPPPEAPKGGAGGTPPAAAPKVPEGPSGAS